MRTRVLTQIYHPDQPECIIGNGLRLIDLIDEISEGKDVVFSVVRSAADIMTTRPRVLTLDDRVETCLKLMKSLGVRHVPIVDPSVGPDGEPAFIGVVSGRDISRLMSPYVGKVGQEDADAQTLRVPLSQIVTRKPKYVSPKTPVPELLTVMLENHIDMLPVLDSGNLAGIVTSTDILKLFVRIHKIRQLCNKEQNSRKKARFLDVASEKMGTADLFYTCFQTVSDIMTDQPVCMDEDGEVGRAITLMQEGAFRHLPIVDKDMKLVGIVSDRNILRHLPPYSGYQATRQTGCRAGLFDVNPADPALQAPIRPIMHLEVMHVPPSRSIYEAATLMHNARINSLVVVDEDRRVRGIVTTVDFMRALQAAYAFEAKQHAQLAHAVAE